jgi:hypothetical protein
MCELYNHIDEHFYIKSMNMICENFLKIFFCIIKPYTTFTLAPVNYSE